MPQGNSPDSNNSPERYETAWKNTPDIEDINTDYTLNENEKYWQYHLPITPENLRAGGKYVSDVRTSTVTLRNGNIETRTARASAAYPTSPAYASCACS